MRLYECSAAGVRLYECSLGIAHNKHVISAQMNEGCISTAGLAVLLSGSWRIAAALPVRSLPSPTLTDSLVHTLRCLWFRRRFWSRLQGCSCFHFVRVLRIHPFLFWQSLDALTIGLFLGGPLGLLQL